MRIVLTTQDGLTKTGLVTTLGGLRNAFPRISWPRDISVLTDQHFIDHGLPARISAETAPPSIAEYGETRTSDDERQPDGTWEQTWSVSANITLGQAKSQLAQLITEAYWKRVHLATPTPAELVAASGDAADIVAARVSTWAGPLQTVVTNIQAASTVAQVFAIYKNLRDQL